MIAVPTHPLAHVAFDLTAWLAGAALGAVLYRWRLRAAVERTAMQVGSGWFAALALGAVTGAWLAGSLNTLRTASPMLSHSVAGGLVGAIAAVELYKLMRGIRGSTGVVFVGSFALGVVIGRMGCLFSGLADRTYGTPTALPWAVDLGDGVGRHPVQVYEALAMALFLAVYLAGLNARAPWALKRGFYVLCAWYGLQRFAWEFLKPYPSVAGPFNLFHLLSLGLIVYGGVFYGRELRRERDAQGRALPVLRPDHEPV
ncbi:prolipoprotein diacylglyceryl transferase family protein [Caulobacter sp. 17J65-9]|uniref:prolipoprotein diacylglyceryl transferase n=1 Tax=Caulobacter sp. 17J65-9 TaxID=2709382 RepID=UPI0013CC1877|nr:prolipoprotein diacylglyceryl transferase family protein [Caulobacter sp. 17J65-9]NEX92015.1 prolipoprotein diacylglyceryl transferase [Caulobacter sp. 17J65-9]